MNIVHLVAIVPVAVVGFALLDMLSARLRESRKAREREELDDVCSCCGKTADQIANEIAVALRSS